MNCHMMMKIALKGITWLITSLFILPTLSLAGPYDVIIVGRESGSEKGFISADETHSKSERDDKGLTQKVGVGCYREHPSLDAKIKFNLLYKLLIIFTKNFANHLKKKLFYFKNKNQ